MIWLRFLIGFTQVRRPSDTAIGAAGAFAPSGRALALYLVVEPPVSLTRPNKNLDLETNRRSVFFEINPHKIFFRYDDHPTHRSVRPEPPLPPGVHSLSVSE